MKMSVTEIFCDLARIPSPTLDESRVARRIIELMSVDGVTVQQDEYGNVYGFLRATDSSKAPLMMTGHMDVVGDASPVVINTTPDGFYETDKTRTLGADDKAGVAAVIALVRKLSAAQNVKHGGIEFLFTRDEEQNLTGAKHVDYTRFKSDYVVVLDGDLLGDFLVSGAGFTKLFIEAYAAKGGHSAIDIDDETRVNAARALAQLVAQMPQGVYEKNDQGIVTSINLGAIAAGGLQNRQTDATGAAFDKFLTYDAVTNVINTHAYAAFSIRSSQKESQRRLHADILKIVADFNARYAGKVVFSADFQEHMLPFEDARDPKMPDLFAKAAAQCGVKAHIASFHAGAETHIYSHKQNAFGRTFKPYLMGAANIYNMHSPNERVEIASMEKGFELLETLFEKFNQSAD